MFLMDTGNCMYIYVGSNTNPSTIKNVFGEFRLLRTCHSTWLITIKFSLKGKNSVNEIPDLCYNLPKLETPSNEALHEFIDALNEEKPYNPTIQVIRWELFLHYQHNNDLLTLNYLLTETRVRAGMFSSSISSTIETRTAWAITNFYSTCGRKCQNKLYMKWRCGAWKQKGKKNWKFVYH